MIRPIPALGAVLAGSLVGLYLLPLAALVLSVTGGDISRAVAHPALAPALALSLRTSAVAMAATVAAGLPLALYLARSRGRVARLLLALLDLPIVLPPAVVGVALLAAFGRGGWLGAWLSSLGIHVPFTALAVVLAQVVVASPFFVKAAVSAIRSVPNDLVDVARTLGASRTAATVQIVLPLAAGGLATGLGLAWARALGEFGATLIFAGNLPGTTQTLPLAIYTVLEGDLSLAIAFSLAAALTAVVLLALVRAGAAPWTRRAA